MPVRRGLEDVVTPIDAIEVEGVRLLVPATEEAGPHGLLVRRNDPEDFEAAGVTDLLLLEREEFVAGRQAVA